MIAESALERGFATLAYSENPYVTPYFGLDQGFEVFDEAFPVSHHLQRKELGADFDSAESSELIARNVNGASLITVS